MDCRLEDELNDPLPLQLESLPLPRDLLCTFPTVGTILRVTFNQSIQKHHLHLLLVGTWVKFVNILCEVRSGLWLGVLTQFTKLCCTSNEDHLIAERQRLLFLWIETWIIKYVFSCFFDAIVHFKVGKWILHKLLPRKCNNMDIHIRLYDERLSAEFGRVPYWCFPWSHITGFTLAFCVSPF